MSPFLACPFQLVASAIVNLDAILSSSAKLFLFPLWPRLLGQLSPLLCIWLILFWVWFLPALLFAGLCLSVLLLFQSLFRCEAGACAMPCTPLHGPFNRAQDKNVRGTCSSKLGIEVTKSGFSSNTHSLRLLANALNCTSDPSNHCATHMIPIRRFHHPNPSFPEFAPPCTILEWNRCGPFNWAQDMNVRGTRSSRTGFSSNVRSLCSLSNAPNRMSDPSNHRANHTIPTGHSQYPNSSSPEFAPHVWSSSATDTACYDPQEWYGPTNSGHPGLGFLFPHPGSHQRLNTSLVRSSFHSSKPLETHSDASRHVFWPITNHLWPRNPLCHGTEPASIQNCIVRCIRSWKWTPKLECKPRPWPQILNARHICSCESTLKCKGDGTEWPGIKGTVERWKGIKG
jgi:hypothetical protein